MFRDTLDLRHQLLREQKRKLSTLPHEEGAPKAHLLPAVRQGELLGPSPKPAHEQGGLVSALSCYGALRTTRSPEEAQCLSPIHLSL